MILVANLDTIVLLFTFILHKFVFGRHVSYNIIDIYWNKSSEIFQDGAAIDIHLKNILKFKCPYSESVLSDMEYYEIYRVPEESYLSCTLPEDFSGVSHVLTCDGQVNEFTSIIDRFSALPGSHGGLTYNPGSSYYFVTLSTGDLAGLKNRIADYSACKKYNMKMKLNVCCPIRHSHDERQSSNSSTTTRKSTTDKHTTHTTQSGVAITSKTAWFSMLEESTPLTKPEYPLAIIDAEILVDEGSHPAPTLLTLTVFLTLHYAIP